MKIKSRYCYTPAAGKIHRNRPTIIERLRRRRKKDYPDVFPVVDYYPPVYPTKK